MSSVSSIYQLHSFRGCLTVLCGSLLIGCASTRIHKYGDAVVRRTDRFTGFDLMVSAKTIYELELPPVNLAHRGRHRFSVRGLHIPVAPDMVVLPYPKRPFPLLEREIAPEWGDATFRIAFYSPRGRSLFTATLPLVGTKWMDPGGSRHALFGYSLGINSFPKTGVWKSLGSTTDYDVVVDVLQPTRVGQHNLVLTGEYLYFGFPP